MLQIKFPVLLKSVAEVVKPHLRGGIPVKGYRRVGKPKKPRKKPSMSLKATMPEMQELGKVIDKNIAYLVYMGKEIASVHGLEPRFIDGQPVGDLADLISEGMQGMLIGGMEAIRSKKTGTLKLVQMKTRAKQRMRILAKRLQGTGVRLPRDLIAQLAIISSATEKFQKANNGENPSREDLADMVILHKRTFEGGKTELNHEETLARIEALEGYKGTQLTDDLDTTPHIEEKDVHFWTKWSHEERELREVTHKVIDEMVASKVLTSDERDVLYLRFYVDKPELSQGMKPRSFEKVAKLLDKKRGIKKIKVRKTVGDTYRFRPMRKVRVERRRRPPGKTRQKLFVTYRYEQYKTSVSAEIVSVGDKTFVVQYKGKKFRIKSKPPFKERHTGPMDVYRIYQGGVVKILKHPSAPKELKQALALVQKSIRVIMPIHL